MFLFRNTRGCVTYQEKRDWLESFIGKGLVVQTQPPDFNASTQKNHAWQHMEAALGRWGQADL